MPAIIPIAAAAIGAAGSIGGGILSSQGASAAARAARPRRQTIPIPPYAKAGQELVARDLALNIGAVPPSFIDFVNSGGTATFPFQNPGLSPLEARQLGVVGPAGQQVPFVQPGQSTLTPEQQMYLGMQLARMHGPLSHSPLANLYRLDVRRERLGDLLQTPGRIRREEKISAREEKIRKHIGERSRAAGTGG